MEPLNLGPALRFAQTELDTFIIRCSQQRRAVTRNRRSEPITTPSITIFENLDSTVNLPFLWQRSHCQVQRSVCRSHWGLWLTSLLLLSARGRRVNCALQFTALPLESQFVMFWFCGIYWCGHMIIVVRVPLHRSRGLGSTSPSTSFLIGSRYMLYIRMHVWVFVGMHVRA
jgi:hypothetical protein